MCKICWAYLTEINKMTPDAENCDVKETDSSVQKQRKPDDLTMLTKPKVCFTAKESNEPKMEVSVQKDDEYDNESGPEECSVDREDKSNIPMLGSERGINNKSSDIELNQNKLQDLSKTVQERPKIPFRLPLMQRHQLSLLEKVSFTKQYGFLCYNINVKCNVSAILLKPPADKRQPSVKKNQFNILYYLSS